MFTKNKVSQSMIDAVNKVLEEQSLEEVAPIKEPTATGMKVYGRSYGNSAKAKQDQSKSSVDDLKGPKTKDLMKKDKEEYEKTKGKYDEAAKPDYLDFDKDGNKTEPMKKALSSTKKVAEELKGDQHKIDANKNKKIDAHDFAILRGKKKVKESFSVRLEEKWKSMKEKKDVVMPEALEKSPEKNQDVADKSHLKDKPGSFKSDLKNLGRFLTGKKETNEEVKKPTGELKDACWKGYTAVGMKMKGGRKVPNCVPEEYTEEQLDQMINEVLGKDATAGDWISDFIHSDNPKFAGKSKAKRKEMALAAYYAKQKNEEVEIDEATIAGTSGWKKMPKDVKDKSGAIHTPMSRAKDLARSAFKKVQDRTKISK